MSIIEHAKRYVGDRGWYVVPLYRPTTTGEHPVCSCTKGAACRSVGKHPIGDDWIGAATNDASGLSTRFGGAAVNIGIAAGRSGLAVIDIDPRADGDKNFARLIRDRGPINWTHEVLTGGLGTHYYFQLLHPSLVVPSRSGVIAPGVDVKSDGGMVVAPPSLHASGNLYRWAEHNPPLAPLAGWLLEAATANAKPKATPAQFVGRWAGDFEKRAERAIHYIARMPVAISGAGGHTSLWRAAVALVRGFELPAPAAREILRDYSTRCEPPWSDKEIEHKLDQAQRASDPRYYPGYLLEART